jgi:hypothetical protein
MDNPTRVVKIGDDRWTDLGMGPALLGAYGDEIYFRLGETEPAAEDPIGLIQRFDATPAVIPTRVRIWGRACLGGRYASAVVASLSEEPIPEGIAMTTANHSIKPKGHSDETVPLEASEKQHSIGDIEARLAAAKTQADRLVPSLQKALSDDRISVMVMALESCERQIYEWRANVSDGLAALDSARERIVRQTVAGEHDLQSATESFRKLAALKVGCGELVEVIDGIAVAIAQKLEARREEEDLARSKKLYAEAIDAGRGLAAAFDQHGPALRSAVHMLLRCWVEAHTAAAEANENLPPGAETLPNPEMFRWGAPMRREVREKIVKFWVDDKGRELCRVDEAQAEQKPDGSVTISTPDGRSSGPVHEVEFVEVTIENTPAAGERIMFPEQLVIPALRFGERPIWRSGVPCEPMTVRVALDEAESPPNPVGVPTPNIEKRLVRRDLYEARTGRRVAPSASGGDGQ